MIYLDYAANTPTDERVLKAFCDTNSEYTGNPNSLHREGRKAKDKMDTITESIGELLGLTKHEIIYTSGASEANNTAIKGIARSSRHLGKHIITSCMEHSSVSGALTYLQEQGYEIDMVDIRSDGTMDLAHLQELLRQDTVLVTVCAVESELGIRQPVREIAEILKGYPDCRLHMDATQAIGKVEIDVTGADTVSFAPHKFFGLNGCGILIKKKELIMEPLIHGGASTTIFRSGTPALSLAASIEKALSIAIAELKERYHTVEELNYYFKKNLRKHSFLRINSTEKSIPHILNISAKGVKASAMQKHLDERDICLSAKSACSAANSPSRPVFAVTKDKKNALSSFRVSLSHLTTKGELDKLLEELEKYRKENGL